jgi:signal transduction histidine kinase
MTMSYESRDVQDPRSTYRDELAEAAHELKTPIAVALALCASATESQDATAMRHALGRIAANVRALREQLDVLLDGERLRSESALRLEAVDLASLVRECTARFGVVAARRRVSVVVDAPSALDTVADRDRVGIAVRNLIANAVRHAQEGGRVRLRLLAVDDGSARIEVADDGPGVPAAMRDAVFERYRRFDRGAARGGSGLGLTIVRDVALAHGGDVTVGTAPEGGALFTLRLPLRSAAARAA